MLVPAQFLTLLDSLSIFLDLFYRRRVSYRNHSMPPTFILIIRSTYPGMDGASLGNDLTCSAWKAINIPIHSSSGMSTLWCCGVPDGVAVA